MSRQPSWSWRIIHWPRPLKWDVVWDMVHRLVADPSLGTVIFETRATRSRIQYRIGADPAHIEGVMRLVADLVPGVQLTTPTVARTPVYVAARLSVSHPSMALDTSRVEALTRAVLAALSGLDADERLVIHLMIGRRLAPAVADQVTKERQSWWSLLNVGVQQASRTEVARVAERRRQHGALVTIRLGATASTTAKANSLMERLFGGLRVAESVGVRLRLTRENPQGLCEARRPWRYPLHLSASEIACMCAWPIGEGELPGLPPISPRILPPPAWLATSGHLIKGRTFATTTAPGQSAPIGIGSADSLLHTVLLGPTGAGKSTAMLHLILGDIHAGRAVVVIDPKNDLVTDVLERIPDHRLSDVVVLDPTDPTPVGLNPLSCRSSSPELTVDALLASFKALFADSWGVRTEEILTAALLTLAKAGGEAASLVTVPSLLTNPTFRGTITRTVHDPLGVSAFWAKYETKSPEQQATEIAPVLNKLQQFVIRPQMRAVLGQTDPKFDLADVFTKKKILLVSLNKGIIGAESARLLGSLLIGQLWPLILGRAKLPPQRRHLTSIYVDEVHDFIHGIPGDLADALAQSRSLGVAWHMAHQYRAQLTPTMWAAIDANARNKICFGLSASDARDMAASAPLLEALDFIRLPRFATYSTTWIGGKETGWISGATKPPPPPVRDAIEPRALSAQTYGTPVATTEAHLAAITGHGQPTRTTRPAGQFGRKPAPTANTTHDEPGDEPQQ